jgi:hypothetical protein
MMAAKFPTRYNGLQPVEAASVIGGGAIRSRTGLDGFATAWRASRATCRPVWQKSRAPCQTRRIRAQLARKFPTMRKATIIAILAITAAAWSVNAHALRCGGTSCGGVVYPPTSVPWYAGLLGLILSE